MEILLHVIFIKFLGWVDNSIKYFSYFILIYFMFKLIRLYRLKKIVLKKELLYFSFFFFFIISFIGNFFILQTPLNNIYIQTLSMYIYNFFISMLFFIIYKEISFFKIVKIFTFYLVLVFIIDFIFMYDFFTNYSIGFIHHIEKNVATVYYGRGCGFFSDPTASSTIVLLFPILLFSIEKYISIKYFRIFFIISFISISITTSKLGIILYLYEVSLLFLFSSRKKIVKNSFKMILYSIVTVVFLLGLIYYLYSIDVKSIVQMIDFFINPSSAKTVTERIYTYYKSFDIINNNILLGIGAGNPQALIGLSIHNTILQSFAENGLLGISFLLYFYLIFPYLVFTQLKYTYLKQVYFIWWHTFFIKSMFIDIMHTHVVIIYFLGFAILYNLNYYLNIRKFK